MQIESLNEERLEELRRLWMGTSDPSEREKITAEGKAIKAYLKNPKWGSEEVDGNGFCLECHLNNARQGHYNCLQCAGQQKVNYRTLQGMQQALLEWSKNKPMERKLSTLEIAEEVFGPIKEE